MRVNPVIGLVLGGVLLGGATMAQAATNQCGAIPRLAALKTALTNATNQSNGGLNNNMWATVVDRNGVVCSVVNNLPSPGTDNNGIWLGSRVISAQKANTGNLFSQPLNARTGGANIALSTANLYTAVQPGGSLFGLQESNPVDTSVAYAGNPLDYGTGLSDPLVGQLIGGVNVFGGGLALYDAAGVRVGGLGVSGDTSCADHAVSWRTRHALVLDYVPGGVSPDNNDAILYDITSQAGQMPGISKSGFGHPHCLVAATENKVAAGLPKTRKIAN